MHVSAVYRTKESLKGGGLNEPGWMLGVRFNILIYKYQYLSLFSGNISASNGDELSANSRRMGEGMVLTLLVMP